MQLDSYILASKVFLLVMPMLIILVGLFWLYMEL